MDLREMLKWFTETQQQPTTDIDNNNNTAAITSTERVVEINNTPNQSASSTIPVDLTEADTIINNVNAPSSPHDEKHLMKHVPPGKDVDSLPSSSVPEQAQRKISTSDNVSVTASSDATGNTVLTASDTKERVVCEAKTKLIWDCNDANNSSFPELSNRTLDKPLTGICFSGGGTRALTAAAGQLRALTLLGLMDKIDYISGISGGSWASAIYVYGHDSEEKKLLGTHTNPQDYTFEMLKSFKLDPWHMCIGATKSFEAALAKEIASFTVPSQVWIDSIGKCFLQPLGLLENDVPYFSYLPETVEEIKQRNPTLKDLKFRTIRQDTHVPFLIIGSCLTGPRAYAPFRTLNPAGFEYTPLYCGIPNRLKLRVVSKWYIFWSKIYDIDVGGCLIEPFAMDSKGAFNIGEDEQDFVLPSTPFNLQHAIGTSSAAVSGICDYHPILDNLSPCVNYAIKQPIINFT